MALDGFIFDLDGTLIDSNDAHLEAWLQAFRAEGYAVERDRIALEIGKGGDKLVAHVLGREAEDKAGDKLRDLQKKAFRERAEKQGIRPFPGAEALLGALAARGLKTALATSSGAEQLEVAEKASGVRWRKLMNEIVTARDVAETKPAPDLVTAAVEKLGFAPGQCAMAGDTAWDVRAANKAGVTLIGLTSGGRSAAKLRRAGARVVLADVAEVGARLDEVLRQLSPGTLRLDAAATDRLMNLALREADLALEEGNVPIGAVLARSDGEVLCSGHNEVLTRGDRTAHAELNAFRRLVEPDADRAEPLFLFSTVEPCLMCLGAAWEGGIDTVVFATPAPDNGGSRRLHNAGVSREPPRPRIIGLVKVEESRRRLRAWVAVSDRPARERRFVDGLLSASARG
jgi:HAD superfamily hydrolase (TIGR01509 family)